MNRVIQSIYLQIGGAKKNIKIQKERKCLLNLLFCAYFTFSHTFILQLVDFYLKKKKQGDTCTKKSTDFLFVCVQKMKFLEDLMRTNEKHYWYDLHIRTYVNKVSLSASIIFNYKELGGGVNLTEVFVEFRRYQNAYRIDNILTSPFFL